jgi:hypothetical protein
MSEIMKRGREKIENRKVICLERVGAVVDVSRERGVLVRNGKIWLLY